MNKTIENISVYVQPTDRYVKNKKKQLIIVKVKRRN